MTILKTSWTVYSTPSMATLAVAQELTLDKKNAAYNVKDYSPFVEQHHPNRVFWADTHLRTANSDMR